MTRQQLLSLFNISTRVVAPEATMTPRTAQSAFEFGRASLGASLDGWNDGDGSDNDTSSVVASDKELGTN